MRFTSSFSFVECNKTVIQAITIVDSRYYEMKRLDGLTVNTWYSFSA